MKDDFKTESQKKSENLSHFRIRHVWEIHSSFKCPVIGACLTAEEHRKVLKKAGCQTKHLKPCQLHRIIMDHLNEENRISLKVDRYLRHKYRDSISAFASLDEDRFMSAWREGFQSGHVGRTFYVAGIKNNLSEESLREIFCETHMLGHANMAEVMGARQDMALQKQAGRKLASLLNKEKKRIKVLKQENSQLRASLNETSLVCDKLKKNRVGPHEKSAEKSAENQDRESAALKEKIRKLENRNIQITDHLRQLEREKRQLQIRLFDQQSANQGLTDEINGLVSRISSFSHCEENCNKECTKCQNCKGRILIVGGISRMKHMYRHLIESAGREFDYHDGYMKNGKQNLEERVRRSDLIICPVNCNSHNACNCVKKFCRKHSKPFRMLPSSSLSAISDVLLENSACAN